MSKIKKKYCRSCKNCILVNPFCSRYCFLGVHSMPMCKINTDTSAKQMDSQNPQVNQLDLQNHNENLDCKYYQKSLWGFCKNLMY